MGVLSFLLDAYENTRKSKSNTKNAKEGRSNNYEFDAGITGDRKLDCPKVKTPRVKKTNRVRKNDEKNVRDDR